MSEWSREKEDQERSAQLCIVCIWFGCMPFRAACHQSLSDPDSEASTLCEIHRARMTEGYCVICSRREPWVYLADWSDTGCCRPCFTSRFGEEATLKIENDKKDWPPEYWHRRNAA